jgi:hypothetical protein
VRSLRLARIAAQAELLRLRLLLRRQANRAMLAVAAVFCAVAALATLHVAAAMALAEYVTRLHAVLIVAAFDAALALLLAALAARDTPGEIEREALRLRRAAVEQAIDTVAVTSLLNRALRVRSWHEFFAVIAAALAAWVLGSRR